MKTGKLFAVVLSAVMLFATIGCDREPDNKPTPPVDEVPSFTFEILDKDKTSVAFRVTPSAENLPYVLMIIDKETFDSFESPEAYIADDLAWFEENANVLGLELREYLSSILITGVKEDNTGGLSPNTAYYLYAYHLSDTGEVGSDLEYIEFTTDNYEKSDVTFEVSVDNIGYYEATVNVVPSSNTAKYFINVFNEEELARFGEGAEAYTNHIVALRDYYLGMGATAEQMIANLCFAGEKSLVATDLKAGVKHYAYAIGVDDNFLPNTEAFVVEFTTNSGEISELTFEVDITGVDYDHIVGSVTPSNYTESYICSIQTAESLDWYDSDEEFMEVLIQDLEWWYGGIESALRVGVTDLSTIRGLYPETDYVVVCFGYNETPTTELFTFPFTTSAANGNPEELVVELIIDESSLTHNSVNVTAKPSVGAYYFMSYISKDDYDVFVEEYGGHDAAIIEYANMEIDYGADYFECSRAEYLAEMGAVLGQYTMLFNQLMPSTEYYAYAVAVDMNSGDIASSSVSVSNLFITLDKVVGKAAVEFEFGNYYDGSELAALDPANFLNCSGYAVLPYTVIPNNDAENWYTGFCEGDFTEWGCTDEDIYAELITYGYEWEADWVSLNRESGVAVLPYDYAYSFLGIAEDTDGNFGAGTLEVITLTKDGVSPAQEFIDSIAQQTSVKATKAATAKVSAKSKSPVVCSKIKPFEISKPNRVVSSSVRNSAKQSVKRASQRIVIGK
ncbi:MAG: hypothetical protein IKY67_12250 [Paludibacteraceae bacterium]|nr:hypothetical protein [Paludibacteraceae bacterium]